MLSRCRYMHVAAARRGACIKIKAVAAAAVAEAVAEASVLAE